MAIVNRRCNSLDVPSFEPDLLLSPVGRAFAGDQDAALRTLDQSPPTDVDIVIIGGGAIGTGLAAHLDTFPALRDRFVILEPHERLVGRYFDTMRGVGQRVMRSPYDHHLAPDGTSQMLDFARLHWCDLTPLERGQVRLGLSGQRAVVPLDIFTGHTAHVAAVHGLARRAYRRGVIAVERQPDGGGYLLRTKRGESVAARAVVLTTGAVRRPRSYAVSRGAAESSRLVNASRMPAFRQGERVAVLGSGLSAGHALLRVVEAGARPVWILRRQEERYQCVDFDSSYFRTEGAAFFQSLPTLRRKLTVLLHESHGSLMVEFHSLLRHLEHEGTLEVVRGAKVSVVDSSKDALELTLADGMKIMVDRLIDMTGVTPDSSLLPSEAQLVGGLYPELTEDLELPGHDGFHVGGILASLALGPAAKNVDGARVAAQRLVPALLRRFSGAAPTYHVRGSYGIAYQPAGRASLGLVTI